MNFFFLPFLETSGKYLWPLLEVDLHTKIPLLISRNQPSKVFCFAYLVTLHFKHNDKYAEAVGEAHSNSEQQNTSDCNRIAW